MPSFERYLERAIGDAGSVLDVGCGANSPLGRFERRYARTVAVDLFEPALDHARAAGAFHLLSVKDVGLPGAPELGR